MASALIMKNQVEMRMQNNTETGIGLRVEGLGGLGEIKQVYDILGVKFWEYRVGGVGLSCISCLLPGWQDQYRKALKYCPL